MAENVKHLVDAFPARPTDLQRRAIERFRALGLPGPRDEEFKHHAVAKLFADRVPMDPEAIPAPEVRYDDALPEGLVIDSLRRALRDSEDGVPEWLGRCADFETRGLTALNTALAGDGALVIARRGAAPAHAVHIRHVTTEEAAGRIVPIRNLIVAEPGSRLTVVEHHQGAGNLGSGNLGTGNLGSGEALNLAVTEIAVGAGARVDHVKIQEEGPATDHLSTVAAVVERDGVLTSRLVAAGGASGRTELRVKLAGPGAECDLSGVALARGDEIRDIFTRVEHAAPHATSRQTFRAVVDDHARGIFNGLVVVPEGAAGTNADQSSRNLLLSEAAEAHTRPQLLIRADDVRCTHGATVGALDPEALFYLRARGIGVAEARRLLVRAFVAEVLEGIDDEAVRERADRILTEWMAR